MSACVCVSVHIPHYPGSNAYTSLEHAQILPHLEKCFQLKSWEEATEITTILPIPRHHQFPCDSPCAAPFIIILCSTISLPLSLLCLGSFSGQPALMLCLVRPQSPKGEGVLNKLLIKHLGFSWRRSKQSEEGAQKLRGGCRLRLTGRLQNR